LAKLKWLDKEQLGVSTTTGLHIVNIRTLQTRNLIIPADSMKYEYKVNYVQDMLSDADGNIFILTRSGFYQFNNKDELVFRYDHYKKEQVEMEVFEFGRNLAKGDNDRVLLSTIDGLYIYRSSKKNLYRANSNDDAFYRQVANPGDRFIFKHSDPNSFSMQNGLTKEIFYFDLSNKTRREIKAPFDILEKFSWRSGVFKLNDSSFAITGQEKGFYMVKYNQQTNAYDILPRLYFESYFCSFLLTDKNHCLWIGTNKGLFKENRPAGELEKITIPPEMNPFNLDLSIRSITIANNKLFLATAGEGLLIADKTTLKPLKKIEFRHRSNSVNNAFHVIALNNDTVLAGGLGALYYINTHTLVYTDAGLPGWKKEIDWIGSLYKDSRNNIYTGSQAYSQFYFRNSGQKEFSLASYPNTPLFNIQTPRYITEDPEGNIWFSGHGMSRFNYRQQLFDLRLDSFPKIKIMRRQVLGLVFDKKGNLYFGTPENGLIIYDPVQKKFEQFTRNDGLPDNLITALYLHKNTLWMGTESGLASYDITTKKIYSFGVSDNMPPGPYTGYSFYYDSSAQQLYGAFYNTILRFNPDKLTKNNSPPEFFIESIEIADEKTIYHPAEKIELSYKQNNFVVNLAAINFEDAYRQQFAYRFVKNGNESWRQIGSQRNIIFSDLSPGNHQLQLKVFIKNNSWPEQVKEINIYIRPPFWQTTWFIILAALLTLSLFYALYRYRIKGIRQKANIDKQLAELEMKGLHSQMNPHFIFNSLNSIREMILNNENKDASH
ncbi:MAG TPA: histidine kinase, partial [Chitinophagaceae bacterium]|nr:histidine kinase [Chitinophagaceae bacterium]